MKKILAKFSVLCMAALLAAGACFAFAACDEDGGGDESGVFGKVSESQWQTALSLDYEAESNFTLTQTTGSTYSQDEAAIYGEWEHDTSTYRVDNEQGIFIQTITNSEWVNDEIVKEDETERVLAPHFETEISTVYYFTEGGKYYCASHTRYLGCEGRESSESWSGGEISLADYTKITEGIANLTAAFSIYSDPMMMQAFSYNEETKSYEMLALGTVSLSLQFLENDGVRLVSYLSSITATTTTISDVNATEVSVPEQARTECGL